VTIKIIYEYLLHIQDVNYILLISIAFNPDEPLTSWLNFV